MTTTTMTMMYCQPISVLPCFSKIFETLVYKRLENYLVRHEILCSNQYGFRKGRSTSLAILAILLIKHIAKLFYLLLHWPTGRKIIIVSL